MLNLSDCYRGLQSPSHPLKQIPSLQLEATFIQAICAYIRHLDITSHIAESCPFFSFPTSERFSQITRQQWSSSLSFCGTRWSDVLSKSHHQWCAFWPLNMDISFYKMLSCEHWSGSSQLKSVSKAHDSCNWLVVEYLYMPLNALIKQSRLCCLVSFTCQALRITVFDHAIRTLCLMTFP